MVIAERVWEVSLDPHSEKLRHHEDAPRECKIGATNGDLEVGTFHRVIPLSYHMSLHILRKG